MDTQKWLATVKPSDISGKSNLQQEFEEVTQMVMDCRNADEWKVNHTIKALDCLRDRIYSLQIDCLDNIKMQQLYCDMMHVDALKNHVCNLYFKTQV